MELQTISQVSKQFSISTRTLRYYEQIGLIQSTMKEDYSYRTYDKDAVLRLKHIIVLRKLRIPLKSIAEILSTKNIILAIEIFRQNLNEIEGEISALTTIKKLIQSLIESLNVKNAKLQFLDDKSILEIADSLTTSKIKFKENKTMSDLLSANERIDKLTDRDVRIVQLPPFTVASYHFIGENPEETVGDVVSKYLKEINLYEIKPDARMFGFNHPNPSKDKKHHGYEDWVTIPEELEVMAPLVKKKFKGGLYAVYTITFPDFHEWRFLHEWAENNEKYAPNYSQEGAANMSGCLEEHLNWVYANHLGWPENFIDGKLDLYLPVKLKN
jgi:DNA-binding transcriptional MerR regulator/DNA gyrase inhibitor GyrI